jgi:hypothetical protein
VRQLAGAVERVGQQRPRRVDVLRCDPLGHQPHRQVGHQLEQPVLRDPVDREGGVARPLSS